MQKPILKLILMMAGLSLLGLLITQTMPLWEHREDRAWLTHFVESASPWLLCLAVGGVIAMLSIGLPRQIVSFVCGMLLGTVAGTALALLLTVLACVVTYGLGRAGLQLLARQSKRGKMRRFGHWMRQQTFSKVLFIRLLPVGSNVLTNLIAGACRVPARQFVAASAVGYIPQTLIFALAGKGIAISSAFQTITSGVLLLLSGFLGIWIARNRHDISDEVENLNVSS